MARKRRPRRVEPAYLWVPEYLSTGGPEVVDFAASCGLVMDPEQRLVLDVMYAEGEGAKLAALEVAVIAARQNLKTVAFEAAALYDLFIARDELIVWTAHLFRTSREAFIDLRDIIDNYDHLRRRVRRVVEAHGAEAVELLTGERLNFLARAQHGGRGLSGDKIFMDEALILSASAMGSLFPTMSARPFPQIRYGSSAGKADSEVLRSIRDRGRKGGDPSLAYLEWCAPDGGCADPECDHRFGFVEGCALDVPENWRHGNPAMDRRITREYIEAERRSLPVEEFTRERMGWWDDPIDDVGFDLMAWLGLESSAEVASVSAYAVEVSIDRAHASVGLAGPTADGVLKVELVARAPRTSWVLDRCVALNNDRAAAGFVIDKGGPAASLISEFEAAGLTVIEAGTAEVGAASAGMVDAVNEGVVVHGLDPDLERAVQGAKRRNIGDGGFAFGRRTSEVDITPLVAVTLAAWAHAEFGAVSASAYWA